MVPESELLFIEQSIRDAAERPVTRRPKSSLQGAQGTHLNDTTTGYGRVHGSAIDDAGAVKKPSVMSPKTLSPIRAPAPTAAAKTKTDKSPSSEGSYEDESYVSPPSDYESDTPEKQTTFNTRAAGVKLHKRPSIVREASEEEETEEVATKSAQFKPSSPATQARREAAPAQPKKTVKNGGGNMSPPATLSTQSTLVNPDPKPASSTVVKTDITKTSEVASARMQSVSPVRTAHFSRSPESLSVRHAPPARSISPMKSALKQPGSRGSSPNGQPVAGLGSARASSEVSDSSALSDDRNFARKKSVRVSFDDTKLGLSNAVTSEHTVTAGRRAWAGSAGRDNAADDDEDYMKPRPELPSFGSVRGKKQREPEDRPLVKPGDMPDRSKATTGSTPTKSAMSHGQSSDHVVGAVIAAEHASRTTATTSKSSEPLPPEVTSVEGSGYVSDSSDGTPEKPTQLLSSTAAMWGPAESGHVKSESRDIPSIAFTQATPGPEEVDKGGAWPNLAGVTPGCPTSPTSDSSIHVVEHHPTEPTPAALGISEPEPIEHPLGAPAVGEIATENRRMSVHEEESDSDGSSIYSDAAEDLSDMQGDGFMSLDAVVESPVVPTFTGTGIAVTTPPDSPISRPTKGKGHIKSKLSQDLDGASLDPEPLHEEGWGKAQKYWSSLTAEKRQEMERSARKDEEEDFHDVDEPPSPQRTFAMKSAEKKSEPPRYVEKKSELPKTLRNPNPDRRYQIAPGTKAAPAEAIPPMRASMRGAAAAAPDGVHMRGSLRSSSGPAQESGHMRGSLRSSSNPAQDSGHMRSSLRNSGSPVAARTSLRQPAEGAPFPPQSKASLQKKYRPMSAPPQEVKPNAEEVKRHIRQMSDGTQPAPKPMLRRRGSSDSQSSFKRARPVTEGYSMKRSMRGSAEQPAPARPSSARPTSPEVPKSGLKSSRFSLRSLSPVGSSIADTNSPRMVGRTMRANRDMGGASLRVRAPESPTKTSFFGRTKQTKPKASSTNRGSRFADSDDEDDAGPAFRSRFVDSSDEEDEVPVPAYRAPPRTAHPAALKASNRQLSRIGDESDELPDSDEEKSSRPTTARGAKHATVVEPAHTSATSGKALNSGSLRRSGSGREMIGQPSSPTVTTTVAAAATPPVRPEGKRRNSILSILRRKKPEKDARIHKADGESGARKDTPLERDPRTLAAVRQNSYMSGSNVGGSTLASPRLQKRNPLSRSGTMDSEAWPLPTPLEDKEEEGGRPGTAGTTGSGVGMGMNGTGRPKMQSRQASSTLRMMEVMSDGGGTPKKKKKFGLLRRALRLAD
jgi:serine/arginine repetitive matrix protein 2